MIPLTDDSKIDVRYLGFGVNLLVQAKTLMVIVHIVRGIDQLLAWLTQMESVSILVQSSLRNRSGGVSNSSMGCGRLHWVFRTKPLGIPKSRTSRNSRQEESFLQARRILEGNDKRHHKSEILKANRRRRGKRRDSKIHRADRSAENTTNRGWVRHSRFAKSKSIELSKKTKIDSYHVQYCNIKLCRQWQQSQIAIAAISEPR